MHASDVYPQHRDYFLIILDGQLALEWFHDEDGEPERVIFSSPKALQEFCRQENIDEVSCSSCIDFPEEETKDKKVLEFCRALRG